MNNVYVHYKTINNEPVSLVIKQTDQILEIYLKQIIRNQFGLFIKNIVLASFLIYLVNYYLQFNSSLLNFCFLISFFILLFRFCTQVVEESLFIQDEQDKVKYSYKYLIGLRIDKFISPRKIIINEGIIYNRVIYYMGALLNDKTEDEKVFPLFCKLLPRLDCLKCIYTSIQKFDTHRTDLKKQLET